MLSKYRLFSVIILLTAAFCQISLASASTRLFNSKLFSQKTLWLFDFNRFSGAALTLTVNNTTDGADTNPGDGVCSDAADDCTLRAAIMEANASPGADVINFNIGGGFQTIAPTASLPAITETVTINGYSQPGASPNTQPVGTDAVLIIEIRGNSIAGGFNHGLRVNADNCVIRGLVINRFSDSGIAVAGNNNTIAGNYIGTDASGVADAGNTFDGVTVFGNNNTIGGATTDARNVISGNNRYGVSFGDDSGNKLQGNYIGINSLGNAALGNSNNGVHLFRASTTQIGGATAGEGNLISGNGGNGVYVFAETIFQTPQANTIAGNLIGTNATGDLAIANAKNGIYLLDSKNNTIGGTAPGARNLISGNTETGFRIEGANATGNQLQGNYIGTNLSGDAALANVTGVFIYLADNNIVGGESNEARNVISGNSNAGVYLAGDFTDFPTNNSIKGNYIGTNAAGTASLPNVGSGVDSLRAVNNQIGGTGAGEGNVISGNNGRGVNLRKSSNNAIQGNIIGLSKATGNALPNGEGGVNIAEGGGNVVSGANYISGNQFHGVLLWDGTSGNTVRGNFIGINPANEPRGNAESGVLIDSSNGNQIGGINAGEGNTIVNNQHGVAVISGIANTIRGNGIFNNENLGIDLGAFSVTDGVTANDAQDADFGANNLQNFPLLSVLTESGGNTVIHGSLNSTPNSNFTIDFYTSVSPDPTLHGEGQTWVGSITIMTDSNGDASFAASVPAFAPNLYVTATATDDAGNTSEFSRFTTGAQTFVVTNTNDSGAGSLRQAILDSNNSPGGDTIIFNIPGAGVRTIAPTSALPIIQQGVLIDGYTQPGASANTLAEGTNATLLIELRGDSIASGGVDGLVLGGGSSLVRGLVINRFSGTGIAVVGNNNAITGNFIGTNAFGSSDLGNISDGVFINAANNRVGGSTPAERNLISGNNRNGVFLSGTSADNNTVKGNLIGTSANGFAAIGNGSHGVAVEGDENRIGGTLAGEGNQIGFNAQDGVYVNGTTNFIQGNTLGLGNRFGIWLTGNNNFVNSANYVLANNDAGIYISSKNNIVRGNFIGVNRNGDARENPRGIWLFTFAENNQIGGTAPGEGNVIANNLFGILVTKPVSGTGAFVRNNSIRGNSIYGQTGGLGIDLSGNDFNPDGVTPNDQFDADTGANNLQNFPVLTNALSTGGTTTVIGSLHSQPSATFNIDFYSNDLPTGQGHGEGQNYLGSTTATTDASGNAAINANFAVDTAGKFITATATDAAGNTSEFSAYIQAASSLVVTHLSDSGAGSLRQAILDANSIPGADTISFNIPAPGTSTLIIQPATNLPMITETVTIDGYTQPGSSVNTSPTGFNANPRIAINGNNVLTQGLNVNGANSLIRGLQIYQFTEIGIAVSAGQSSIKGCFLRNNLESILIYASGTTVGGTNNADRNHIAQNAGAGISIYGASDNSIINNAIGAFNGWGGNLNGVLLGGGTNNVVGGSAGEGNYIVSNSKGVTVSQNLARATISQNYISQNSWGVSLTENATGNLVERNFIFSNQRGVNLDFGASGNSIKGNTIGINPSGSAAGNGFGVNIDGEGGATNNNIVGGTAPGEANTIHHNTYGVVVYTGAGAQPVIGNRISGNSIHNNQGLGIDLNFNGVTPNDAQDADGGPNNQQNFPVLMGAIPVGGSSVINGTLNSTPNSMFTIEFFTSSVNDPSNFGEGQNYTGSTTVTTDAGGNASFSVAVPLLASNLFISSTATDVAGNTSEFSRNIKAAQTFVVTNTNGGGGGSLRQAILDANMSPGTDLIHFNIPGAGTRLIEVNSSPLNITESVIIDGYTQPGASVNTLSTGDNAVILIHIRNNGSLPHGFGLFASNVTIRGIQVSNFNQTGIGINFDSSNNIIEGNWLTGNMRGIQVFGANNRVGGALSAQRNIISGNTLEGVALQGGNSSNNLVQNNYIGTDFSGTAAVPNANGIVVSIDAASNTIGGTTTGTGNLIAFNNGTGVVVAGDNTRNNRLNGNSLHSNMGLGIDLGGDGVTPNDPGDPDSANNFQNYPVINIAAANVVSGILTGAPNASFRIEFFANPTADASGYGEGASYLGFVNVTTDAGGNAAFSFNPQVAITVGQFVSATATDAAGNTSEFSLAKIVSAPTAASVTVGGRVTDANGRGILKAVVTLTDGWGNERMATTNQSGYYRFANVQAGASYVFTVRHKRFQFAPSTEVRFISQDEDDLNFVGIASQLTDQ